MDDDIRPDDAFAEMAALRGGGKTATAQKPTPEPAPQQTTTPGAPPAAAAPAPTAPAAVSTPPAPQTEQANEEEAGDESTTGGRNVLQGVYIDNAMDDFLEHYASQRIAGTRKKPSRSLVSYWLMQLGMQALEAQGRPPMPSEFAKRRR